MSKWNLAPRSARYTATSDDGEHYWEFEALSIGVGLTQKLIVPLDYNTREEAQALVDRLNRMDRQPTRLQELESLISGHVEAMRPLLDEWSKLRKP